MKLIYYALLSLFFLTACETIENEVIVINPKAQMGSSINLKISKILNDSTIELSWNKYSGSNFKEYRLYRAAEILKNGNFVFDNQVIKTFHQPDSLTYWERKMPFSRNISYVVAVITDTLNNHVGRVSYERPNTFHSYSFQDALIDTATKQLYVYSMNDGAITLFNYETNKELKKVSLNSSIGYCALGNFEGGINNEL